MGNSYLGGFITSAAMNTLIHIFGKHMHNVIGIDLGVELLGHQVCTFLALINSAMQTYKVILPIDTTTSRLWEFQYFISWVARYIFHHFYFILVCVLCYYIVILIYISWYKMKINNFTYMFFLFWISSFVKCLFKSFVHLLDKLCFPYWFVRDIYVF